MFKSIELFQSAHQMAKHAASQQAVVATNIANSDTPDFKALTMPSRQADNGVLTLKTPRNSTTRVHHIELQLNVAEPAPVRDSFAPASPNGNTVSLENEILKSIDAERQHSRALTVYQTTLGILRTSIGRGR